LNFDSEFGGVTTSKVKAFQKRNGLEDDGCFGPNTRALAKKRFNFDFEAAALTIPGETIFYDNLHKEESVIFENEVSDHIPLSGRMGPGKGALSA